MLSEITIENVAVIEKADVRFSPGFTVLTGETGAGKSIMVDSINAILGNRASKDLVRSGAAKARVYATFCRIEKKIVQKLEELGYSLEEDDLILQREISSEGKNHCRIGGAPATAAVLKEVGGELIQIHGQHDTHSLTNVERHLPLLDLFGGLGPLLAEYGEAYTQLVALNAQISALSMNESEKTRKIDLLRYELQEIEAAGLSAGEEEELLERRNVVRNTRALLEALNGAQVAITGDEEVAGAVTLLGQASSLLDEAAEIASPLKEIADAVRDAYYAARDWEGELQHSIMEYSESGESLDHIETRLDLLYRLKQKYGPTIENVIEYGEKAGVELGNIEMSSERLAELEKQKARQLAATQKLADTLSQKRKEAFARFYKEIQGALEFLGMPGVRMDIRQEKTSLGPSGQDEIEFLLSANPGEAPKPLAKIASGGELARVMLAVKNTLAQRDDMPTVIYDEIDTGISGQAAGKIGRMLKDTAGQRQVICVTHTAQIAAFADHHLYIEKQVDKGRTYTKIRVLNREERVEELARIVSGDNITEAARANAEEMLELAESTG